MGRNDIGATTQKHFICRYFTVGLFAFITIGFEIVKQYRKSPSNLFLS